MLIYRSEILVVSTLTSNISLWIHRVLRIDVGEQIMWFENLTGFNEQSPDQVRKNLEVTGNIMTSKINTLVGGELWAFKRPCL